MRFYKLLILIAIVSIHADIINAQSLSSYVASNAGGYWQTAGYSLQYNVGETNVSTYNTSNQELTQGFEQSQVTVTGIPSVDDNNDILIYPNPASTEIVVDLTKSKQSFDIAYFTDVLGRRISVPLAITPSGVTCNVSPLASGVYILNLVMKNSSTIYSYKVIKTQTD